MIWAGTGMMSSNTKAATRNDLNYVGGWTGLLIAKELAARIRALLRRARPAEEEPGAFTFGDLQLLPEQGVLRRLNGDEVHCTRTEFRLLCELAASPNKVLSREQLLDRVWGYDYFGDGRLVDVHIRRLRTKVEADPAVPQHILTVRGMGYKLVP